MAIVTSGSCQSGFLLNILNCSFQFYDRKLFYQTVIVYKIHFEPLVNCNNAASEGIPCIRGEFRGCVPLLCHGTLDALGESDVSDFVGDGGGLLTSGFESDGFMKVFFFFSNCLKQLSTASISSTKSTYAKQLDRWLGTQV